MTASCDVLVGVPVRGVRDVSADGAEARAAISRQTVTFLLFRAMTRGRILGVNPTTGASESPTCAGCPGPGSLGVACPHTSAEGPSTPPTAARSVQGLVAPGDRDVDPHDRAAGRHRTRFDLPRPIADAVLAAPRELVTMECHEVRPPPCRRARHHARPRRDPGVRRPHRAARTRRLVGRAAAGSTRIWPFAPYFVFVPVLGVVWWGRCAPATGTGRSRPGSSSRCSSRRRPLPRHDGGCRTRGVGGGLRDREGRACRAHRRRVHPLVRWPATARGVPLDRSGCPPCSSQRSHRSSPVCGGPALPTLRASPPRAPTAASLSMIVAMVLIAGAAALCPRWMRARVPGVLGGWLAALVAGGVVGIIQAIVAFVIDGIAGRPLAADDGLHRRRRRPLLRRVRRLDRRRERRDGRPGAHPATARMLQLAAGDRRGDRGDRHLMRPPGCGGSRDATSPCPRASCAPTAASSPTATATRCCCAA